MQKGDACAIRGTGEGQDWHVSAHAVNYITIMVFFKGMMVIGEQASLFGWMVMG